MDAITSHHFLMKNRVGGMLEGLKRVKMNISGWATEGGEEEKEEVHKRGVKATKKKAFGRAEEGERWTFVCCHAGEVRDCESVTYKINISKSGREERKKRKKRRRRDEEETYCDALYTRAPQLWYASKLPREITYFVVTAEKKIRTRWRIE